MTDTATTQRYEPGKHPELPPPNLASGPIYWVKENLLSSWYNIFLTFLGRVVSLDHRPAASELGLVRRGLRGRRPGRMSGSGRRRLLGVHLRALQDLHLRLLPGSLSAGA